MQLKSRGYHIFYQNDNSEKVSEGTITSIEEFVVKGSFKL